MRFSPKTHVRLAPTILDFAQPPIFRRLFSSLKISNTVVQNPTCKTCKNYRQKGYDENSDGGFCLDNGENNLVDGKVHYMAAKLCRKNDTYCGEKGGKYVKETDSDKLSKMVFYYKTNPVCYFLIIWVGIGWSVSSVFYG